MHYCRPVAITIEINTKLTKDMGPSSANRKQEMKEVPYKQAVGFLLDLYTCIRSDHTCRVLSHFNNNAGMVHWRVIKRVMRYQKQTKNYTIKKTEQALLGFIDANWGGDFNDRKSYMGFVFVLSEGVISWEVHSKCVTLRQSI